MAHEDWDLFAIVQSCKAATFTASSSTTTTETPPPTTTTNITRSPQNTTATSCLEAFSTVSQENGSFPFPNIVQPRTNNGFLELHQLLMNFNPTTTTGSSTSTSGRGINPISTTFSDLAGLIGQQEMQQGLIHDPVPVPTTYSSIGASTTSFDRFHHHHQQQQQQPPPTKQQQQEPNQLPLQVPQTSSMVLPSTQPQTPRSRKRKSQQKKMVCHVTADNLSTDLWAWRKYGQKPIKGSPYPRNYYRCSSCKGCAARKQVERSTTEPNMFIVTYTGDHKHAKPVHRNSLAGSTRNKPPATRLPSAGETGSPPNAGSVSSSSSVFSPTLLQSDPPENGDAHVPAGEPEGADPETEPDAVSDDDDVLIPNLAAMSDAFLLGLDHFDGGGDGGAKPSFGSDLNSVPGLNRSSSEPSSNNTRSSPG